MTTTGAAVLVAALQRNGVRHVFGIPGVHTLPIYDALQNSGIEPVIPRNEQAAGYAAEAYAKVAGRPAVCLVVPGPGHLASGVASVRQDSAPVLAITAEVATHQQNRSATHDTDLEALFRPLVKASFRATTAGDIAPLAERALAATLAGRPGPVQLLIAADLLRAEAGPVEGTTIPAAVAAPPGGAPTAPHPTAAELDAAATSLVAARNPVLYVGCGVHWAGAQHELLELAERLQAPVFTSASGRGVFPENHPLSMGVPSFPGTREVLAAADCCLAVGTVFSEISTVVWYYTLPENLIQIDIDPREIGKNYPARLGLVGDAGAVLRAAVARIPPGKRGPGAVTRLAAKFRARGRTQAPSGGSGGGGPPAPRHPGPPPPLPPPPHVTPPRAGVHPAAVIRALRRQMPPETIFTTDGSATEFWFWDPLFELTRPRTFVIPEVYQTMGYALPAAIGARLARPESPVVCAVGDGSLLFLPGELATAAASTRLTCRCWPAPLASTTTG